MLVFYIFLLSHAVLGDDFNKEIYNLEDAEILFESFVRSYDKVYMNEVEKNERFTIFKDNLIEIIEWNEVYPSTSYAINEFADLTTEEFMKTHTGQVPKYPPPYACQVLKDHDLTPGTAPATYDLREKIQIQVKNQKTCSSAWAFAATGSVEVAYHLKYNSFVSLSEQQVVDCNSRGCQDAECALSVLGYLAYAGQELDSVYPYVDAFQSCQFNASNVKVNLDACIVFDLKDEDKIREALYSYGAVVAEVDAFTWQKYKGGIMKNCISGTPNHAVLIVGYGTNKEGDYWIIKNSWGENWGEKGYVRIPRGQDACSILNLSLGVAVIY